MSWVQSGRFLDSAILGLFVMLISATALQLFSRFWAIATRPEYVAYKVGPILKQIFRMNKNFDFNLTHVLLMSIIICLISLRPDSELEATKKHAPKKAPASKTSKSTVTNNEVANTTKEPETKEPETDPAFRPGL